MSVARPDTAGKTRTCPHCKATILESLTICPGCLHHLRFDQPAAKRQVAATSALRVEGVIEHPTTAKEPWEYFVVIAVRNDRGEEITRQVVNVGALQNAEKRTFALSVEVMPSDSLAVPKKPTQAAASTARPSAPKAPLPTPKAPLPRPPAAATAAKPGAGSATSTAKPGVGATPAAAAAKPIPGSLMPPKR